MLGSANPEALKGSEYTVRQLLDDFSAALADQLKDQPEVEAAVRATIGRAYFRLGVTDKALGHQERVLTLRRGILGEQTEPVAESLVDCAWTCFEQMQYAKGESYAREALEIYRRRGTAGPPVIYGLWAWQRMLIAQARFGEVEAVMEEALTIARQSPTVEFPDLASMIHGLADVKNLQSQHAEAESLALKAVSMHRRLHGAEHPETGWALVTAGVALRRQQKLADAEGALQEALRIFRKYHSSRHNSVDAAINELKLVFEARGDSAAVEALYREILAGQRAKLGNDSPAVAETLNNLGIVLLRAGKRPEAELLFQEAEASFRADLALRRQRFGDVDREVEVALLALAQALQQAGKLAEAEAVYREELAMERKLSGDEHPSVANSLHVLATVLRDSGKLPEAETTAREALEIREKRHGNEHTDVAQALHLLAWNLNLQGKHIEAEALSRREVAMWRKLLDNEHPNVAWALGDLSIFLRDQGKLADAETTIREALAIRQKRSGNTPPPAIDHLTLLVELLRAQGKLAEAKSMYREAAQRGGAPELNQFAWLLATSPDANLRDGTNAVVFAEQAVDATNRKNVRYLETLAAAHAETGQFASAVSAQQEAIALSKNEQERKDLASRLKLYDSHLPYRDHGSLAELTRERLTEARFAEAEALARECLAIRELQIPDDWRTFNTRSMLGGALLGQKKYADAEPLLTSGYDGMKQREKTIALLGKVRIREALQRLSQLHQATGQPGKAVEWNKKLAEFDRAEAEKQVATPKPQSQSQP